MFKPPKIKKCRFKVYLIVQLYFYTAYYTYCRRVHNIARDITTPQEKIFYLTIIFFVYVREWNARFFLENARLLEVYRILGNKREGNTILWCKRIL